METPRQPFRQVENAMKGAEKRSSVKNGPMQTPVSTRKSPRRKKARVNDGQGEEENSMVQDCSPSSGATASPTLVDFSPSSNSSEPALRFESSDEELEDDANDTPRKSGANELGQEQSSKDEPQAVSSEDSDSDSDSDSEDSDAPIPPHVSTPPMSEVDLNTRRNSLRPVYSDLKSERSSRRRSLSSNASGDEGATVTLAAFNDMLKAADLEDGENTARDGDSEQESEKGGRKPAIDSDQDSGDSEDDDNSSRRNTASPSFIMKMLDTSDDEEEEEMLEAVKRGKEDAEKIAQDTSNIFKSPVKNADPTTPSPVGSRTRSSVKKKASAARLGTKEQSIPGKVALSAKRPLYNPTPLKSCISARKDPTQSRFQKKSVVFGSPNAAEFHQKDPVLGGVTPLAKNYARSRFLMEDNLAMQEELVEEEEEGDTALNSSILATWEEPESAKENSQSSRSKSGSRRKKNGSSSGGSSRRKDRRQSSVYDPGTISGDDLAKAFDEVAKEDERESASLGTETPSSATSRDSGATSRSPPSPVMDKRQSLESDGGDTADFSTIAKLAEGMSPASSGRASSDTIDFGAFAALTTGTPRSQSSERQSLASSAPSTPSLRDEDGDATMDIAGLSKILDFSQNGTTDSSRPDRKDEQSKGHLKGEEEEERTMELGALSELASFSPGPSQTSSRPQGSSKAQPAKPEADGEHTVELGELSDLTDLSATNQQPSGSNEMNDERTVELGRLSELANLGGDDETTRENSASEDHTMDLGQLSELADFGGNANSNDTTPGRSDFGSFQRRASTVGGGTHLTPVSEGDEESPHRGPKEDDNKDQRRLRLSFSSLGSGRSSHDGGPLDGAATGSNQVFDSAALLDQFVNSPDSVSSKASTPSKQQGESGESVMTPRSDVGDAFEAKKKLPRTPVGVIPNVDEQIPQGEGKDTPGRSPLKGMQSGSQADIDTEGAGAVSEDDPRKQAQDTLSIPEPEPKPEPEEIVQEEPVDTTTFLDQFGLKLGGDNYTTNLEMEEPFQQIASESAYPPLQVSEEQLDNACTVTVEMYGLKWAINELCNRTAITERTIRHIAVGLSKDNPPLFRKNAESVETQMSLLVKAAECEARMAWTDLSRKAVNRSMQAGKEHVDILREDQELLEEGIARLDEAVAEAQETLEQRKRLVSLEEALDEQRVVLEGYRSNVAELEEKERSAQAETAAAEKACLDAEAQVVKLREELAQNEAVSKMQMDLEGRNTVLDLAQGLHAWRLHRVCNTPSLIVLAFDQTKTSELVSISYEGTPLRISSVRLESEVPDMGGSSRRKLADESLVSEIELVTRKRLSIAIARLHQTYSGEQPGKVADILGELDIEFGRLEDMWDEVCEIASSTWHSFSVQTNSRGAVELSAELLHNEAAAVVQATFELGMGYPVVEGSCSARFSIMEETGKSDLLDHVKNIASKATKEFGYAPLTAIWAAIQPIFA